MPPKGTNFYSVTCNQDPDIETKETTLREVRQHVMYEYFRKRRESGKVKDGSSRRQRRIGEGRDPPSQHIFEGTETAKQTHQQHVLINNNNFSYDPASLQSHRFDPFGALPVNGIYIDAVAHWHCRSIVHDVGLPEIPSVELMAKQRILAYWRKSQGDKGHFHSLICLVDAKRARSTGRRDNVRYLVHKGEAIKMLNAEIECSRDNPSDQLIVLMYCLSDITLLDEGKEAAKLHMHALIEAATRSPDLSRFGEIAFLFIVRNDLRLAASAFHKPVLPFCNRYTHLQPSVSLLSVASQLTLQSLRGLGGIYNNQVVVHGTFQKLHELALLCDLDIPSIGDARCLEGAMYWVDYHLCVLASDETVSCPERVFHPLTIVSIAAQLFAWSCLRLGSHSWQTASMKGICRRLCGELAQTTTLLEDWQEQGQLESLLWVLFTAHSTSHTTSLGHEPVVSRCRELGREKEHATRTRPILRATGGLHELASDAPLSAGVLLVERLREVVARLGIYDEAEFENALRLFPWTKHSSPGFCKRAWSEVSRVC